MSAKISHAVYNIDKLQLAASPYSRSSSTELLLPTEAAQARQKRHFQVWDEQFRGILGSQPSIEILIDSPTFAFAWEAPVYVRTTDEVWFCSMAGQAGRARSDVNRNNQIGKIKLGDVKAGSKREDVVTDVTPDHELVQMTNGGTNYGSDQILFICQGRGPVGGSLQLVNVAPPHASECILANNFGKRFNAPNDVVVHPRSGAIYFTDPIYAYYQKFAPPPQLRNLVYRFDPATGELRVMTDAVKMPNGIVFSPDGRTAYVTDTMAVDTTEKFDGTAGTAVYAFDVLERNGTEHFVNWRMFATVDTGVADGIKVDRRGNVYAACGDGVHVWLPTGALLGKIFVGETIGNLVFCDSGRLVFQSGERMYLARLADHVDGPDLESYPTTRTRK